MMASRWSWLTLGFLASMAHLSGGCKECKALEDATIAESGTLHRDGTGPGSREAEGAEGDGGYRETWEPLVFDNRLFVLAGGLDVDNRYSATVMVTARLKEGTKGRCSGVVIAPRLVLTAGHCVCNRRTRTVSNGEPQQIIDSSECVQGATVETVSYDPADGMNELGSSQRDVYKGEVRPHPGFQILLDGQGRVRSSSGDLAVIHLNEPLGKNVPPVLLSDSEVQINEMVTIVGYGYDELLNAHGSERRFSRNKVTQIPKYGGERVLVEQPGKHMYRQDSGGPCLREDATGLKLVGISSRNLGEGSAFISIHGHQDWLMSELQRAANKAHR